MLHNVQIFENDVPVEDHVTVLQAKAAHQHQETGIVLGQRFVGECSSSNQAIHSKEDSYDLMERKAAFTRLLKKTSLTKNSNIPQPAPAAAKISGAGTSAASTSAWVSTVLSLEQQLAVAEAQLAVGGTSTGSGTANSSGAVGGGALLKLPTEDVLSDAETILEDLHSSGPDHPNEIKKSLEVLNEKLDVCLSLAKRNRMACLQSIDTDVEVTDDATATLMLVEAAIPRAQQCTKSVQLLKSLALDWPALKKHFVESHNPQPTAGSSSGEESKKEGEGTKAKAEPLITEEELVALETAVSTMEQDFDLHEANTLAKLDAFEEEYNMKFNIKPPGAATQGDKKK